MTSIVACVHPDAKWVLFFLLVLLCLFPCLRKLQSPQMCFMCDLFVSGDCVCIGMLLVEEKNVENIFIKPMYDLKNVCVHVYNDQLFMITFMSFLT